MATQTDLFLAILALDAYNRGDSPGMTLPSDAPTTQTGGATILDTFTDSDTSFYAIAYQWQGETIISYRGTRFDGALGPNLGDVLSGWTLSLGLPQASQAQEALAFYDQVKGETNGPIVLTGHSLGGGLAGFVSDLTGASADVFNNIPFGTGVAAQIFSNLGVNTYGSLPASSATVQQFITFGEVATGLRAASPALSLATLLAGGMDPLAAAAAVAYGTTLARRAD